MLGRVSLVVTGIGNGVAHIKDDENEVREECFQDDDEAEHQHYGFVGSVGYTGDEWRPCSSSMLDRSVLVFQFRRKRARPDNYPRAWLQIPNNVRSTPHFRSSSCYHVGCIAAALGFTALGFVVRGVVVIFHSLLNLRDIHFTRRSGISSTPPWPRQACKMLPAPSAVVAAS